MCALLHVRLLAFQTPFFSSSVCEFLVSRGSTGKKVDEVFRSLSRSLMEEKKIQSSISLLSLGNHKVTRANGNRVGGSFIFLFLFPFRFSFF